MASVGSYISIALKTKFPSGITTNSASLLAGVVDSTTISLELKYKRQLLQASLSLEGSSTIMLANSDSSKLNLGGAIQVISLLEKDFTTHSLLSIKNLLY